MMDSSNEENDDIEDQFILRLPTKYAEKVRKVLHKKPKKLKKYLKIDLNVTECVGKVSVGKTVLNGYLQKFPTIIESYKTNISNDKTNLCKTADICQILQCQKTPLIHFNKNLNHGLTPPLKNVKTKRFRKTRNNPEAAERAETLSKELHYLLKADFYAVSSRFELIDDEKKLGHSDDLGETVSSIKELFGDISPDSESET